MVASLSSWNWILQLPFPSLDLAVDPSLDFAVDPSANSSNGIAGRPTNLSAVSAATISASGVEWLTQVCRLETAAI
eukprot:414114-Amphidinium_carterae.1